MGTEAIDVTEVFIRLQRRQVLYNAAILIFITVLLIFFVRGKYLHNISFDVLPMLVIKRGKKIMLS